MPRPVRRKPSALGISSQLVGAYGERAVEAELLRRNWVTANVNSSIKNAAGVDIFAHKGDNAIGIRVKTSGPGTRAFQFGFPVGRDISIRGISPLDFTILVDMGTDRANDHFYIVPTRLLFRQINRHRESYLSSPRRDGEPRKDLGMWTLHLRDMKKDPHRFSHGFAKKWEKFRENWSLLERSL